MSVFTEVTYSQALCFLENYVPQPEIHCLQGITAGVENTNYFLTFSSQISSQRYCCVLTLFEMLSSQDLPFFVGFSSHLSEAGLPVPAPLKQRNGIALSSLNGRPCLLLPRLPGKHLVKPRQQHLRQLGLFIGNMHVASESFGMERDIERGPVWMRDQQLKLHGCLNSDDEILLNEEIAFYESHYPRFLECPSGVGHMDLFVDNALFHGGKLGGVIDFYHACVDAFIIDAAVTCNDWCCDNRGRYNLNKVKAFCSAYQQVRPWTEDEFQLWPVALRVGALRFWLSRLVSITQPGYQKEAGNEDVMKDPTEMLRKIRSLRNIKQQQLLIAAVSS